MLKFAKCISNCFISLTLNLKVAGPILVSINVPFCREFHSCLKIQIPYERISTLKYPILPIVIITFILYKNKYILICIISQY